MNKYNAFRILLVFGIIFCLFKGVQELSTPAIPRSRELDARKEARSLAPAVAFVEGWSDPKNLVQRLNNPGALRYAGQTGATVGEQGYANFRTAEEGFTALEAELTRRILRVGYIGSGDVCVLDISKNMECSIHFFIADDIQYTFNLADVFENWAEAATGAEYAEKVNKAREHITIWIK